MIVVVLAALIVVSLLSTGTPMQAAKDIGKGILVLIGLIIFVPLGLITWVSRRAELGSDASVGSRISPTRYGSANSEGYLSFAIILGLVGLIFWPLLIFSGMFVVLWLISGIFHFDILYDGKTVKGGGILNGLPIGCAIPFLVIIFFLFFFLLGKR